MCDQSGCQMCEDSGECRLGAEPGSCGHLTRAASPDWGQRHTYRRATHAKKPIVQRDEAGAKRKE